MTTTANLPAVRDDRDMLASERPQPGALAIRADQTAWDKMQLAALGQLGLKGAPEGDLMVFLHVSQRMGLDPFARQIYMIKRREKIGKDQQNKDIYGDKWTIQTGIDGFRVQRARAERRAGVRGILSRPVFYDRDGNECKAWWRADTPAACEITYTLIEWDSNVSAYRETPYASILRFDEYAQGGKNDNGTRYLTGQWATKGSHMLEKCCEADVYRKAFPQDFSGILLDDAAPAPEAADVQPGRPAPEVADLRQRAAAQTVQSTAVTSPSPAPGAAPSRDELLTEINAHLERLEVHPDNRLAVVSQIVRRPLKSTRELGDGEVRNVRDTLESLADGAALDGLRAEALMDDEPQGGEPGGE